MSLSVGHPLILESWRSFVAKVEEKLAKKVWVLTKKKNAQTAYL